MKQRHEQQMFQQKQFFQQALKKERDAQSGLGGNGVEMQTLHASQAIAHPCCGAPRAARACDGA
eukprot:2325222-Amphidinium_carterae.1